MGWTGRAAWGVQDLQTGYSRWVSDRGFSPGRLIRIGRAKGAGSAPGVGLALRGGGSAAGGDWAASIQAGGKQNHDWQGV